MKRVPGCAAALLAMVASLLLFPPGSQASDGSGIDIEVLSPTNGSTLGGTVTVRYRVTAPAGASLSAASVSFMGRGVETDLRGLDCSRGCVGEGTFDTATTPTAWQNENAKQTDDGPTWFGISAEGPMVGSESRTLSVVLDNQRPSVRVLGLERGGLYPLTAEDVLRIEAYPTSRPGGRVTRMALLDRLTELPMEPPTHAGGPWTIELDTSSRPSTWGSYGVRAYDDRGVGNIGVRTGYVVDVGPQLSAPTFDSAVPDDELNRVTLGYRYSEKVTLLPETRISRIRTLVDGVETDVTDAGIFEVQNPGQTQAYSGSRVPAGHRTLTYEVTDSRGKTTSVDIPVEVVRTLFSEWNLGQARSVLPDAVLHMTGRAWSTRTTLTWWSLKVNGMNVAGGGDPAACSTDCPTSFQMAARLPTRTPGVHSVELLVVPRDGHTEVLRSSYRVLDRAIGHVDARRPVTFGREFTLRGWTRVGGVLTPGVEAVLQRRVVGTTTWHRVATTRSDRDGVVRFRPRATRNADYRIVTVARDGKWGRSVGRPRRVGSRAAIGVWSSPSRVRFGGELVVTGIVAPRSCDRARLRLQSWQDGQWVTHRDVCPSADGRFRLAYRPHRTGRIPIRLLRPAGGQIMTTPRRLPAVEIMR